MTEDEKINAIIHSLGYYAKGDITSNLHLPIAAFILCSSWIDQMSSFRYSQGKPSKRYKDFVEAYLNDYEDLELFTHLRSRLVHHYSLKHFKITSDHIPIDKKNSEYATVLSIHDFFEQAKTAFQIFKRDLNSATHPAREEAIKRFKDFPPLLQSDYIPASYTEAQADVLVRHYDNILQGKPLVGHTSEMKIFLLEIEAAEEENMFSVKVIAKNKRGLVKWKHLNEVTIEKDLPSPRGILIEKGLLTDNSHH
jgi:hypothetical protein